MVTRQLQPVGVTAEAKDGGREFTDVTAHRLAGLGLLCQTTWHTAVVSETIQHEV